MGYPGWPLSFEMKISTEPSDEPPKLRASLEGTGCDGGHNGRRITVTDGQTKTTIEFTDMEAWRVSHSIFTGLVELE